MKTLALLLLAAALAPIAYAQEMPMEHHAAASKPATPSTSLVLTIAGKATTLTLADLQAMPQKTLVVKNGHTQAQETYTGVAVGDLLARHGFAFENATAKKVYHSYVRAEGMDGYWVLYSASELEDILRETGAIVALTLDGKPLASDEGQFKIVVAGERRPARWVRNLKSLTVVTVE
jgi:hypothetical protein